MSFTFPNNPENAEPMAKYMKNKFFFCGVKKPERTQLSKDYLKASQYLPLEEVFQLIAENYAKEEREYHYLAIDLAERNTKRLTLTDLERLLPYIGEKSWWDSVDAWRKVFGLWIKQHPEQVEEVFNWFYGHPDFWYRRVAINLQLMAKEQTNIELLTKAILADQHTNEFFIQKAIGWSLREYSKTDPAWVENFIQRYDLSKLAIREGSKYLSKNHYDSN